MRRLPEVLIEPVVRMALAEDLGRAGLDGGHVTVGGRDHALGGDVPGVGDDRLGRPLVGQFEVGLHLLGVELGPELGGAEVPVRAVDVPAAGAAQAG